VGVLALARPQSLSHSIPASPVSTGSQFGCTRSMLFSQHSARLPAMKRLDCRHKTIFGEVAVVWEAEASRDNGKAYA